ncbi:MAG: sodium/proton-translocating pyrophosphatase [Fimbriimonadaceae bacterium]
MHRYVYAALKIARHRGRALLIAAGLTLLPLPALADDGNVVMHFAPVDKSLLGAALGLGLVAVIFAMWIRRKVMAEPAGSDEMQEVGKAIREGALAYLRKQVQTMAIFVVVIALGLFALFFNREHLLIPIGISICFVVGVAASYLAGYTGMLVAVAANMRTAHAALTSNKKPLEVAFRSGAVTGLMTVGLGLVGASAIFLFTGPAAIRLLVGFGFGGSLAALFMRVGGGIFTKAADVGADLVGKIEKGIPEDDPRNPATIADNVGDNVGDCAGMAADVFESYSVMLVAAIVLAAASSAVFDERTWMRLVILVLSISAIGIIASIIGIFSVKGSDDVKSDPLKLLRRGFLFSTFIAVLGVGLFTFFWLGGVGSPIRTSTLVSIDRLRNDEKLALQEFREEVAKASGKKPYQISAADLIKDPRIKKLGMSDEELQRLGQTAFDFHEDTSPPAPSLSGFQPVDFNDAKSPVLQYGVRSMDATSSGGIQSFKDAYAVVDDELTKKEGHPVYKQVDIAVYDVTVQQLAKNGQPAPKPQEALVGPLPSAAFEKGINSLKDTTKVTENAKYMGYLYYNPETGKVAVAVDGKFETARLNRQPFTYYAESAAEVTKATTDSNGQTMPSLPEEQQAIVAEIQHVKVPWYLFFLPIIFGVALAFGIEQLTDYYVSTHRKPTQEVAGVAGAGAAPMIIQGFSYALESSAFMVAGIVLALLVPLWIFPPSNFGGSFVPSFFGVALVGLGLLATTGFVLAMDTFGPISDNAQGVFEMSGAASGNAFGAGVVARLDAAGNTTKALTKGFAITTAVIAATALFHSFLESAHLSKIGLRLDYPEIFLGFLIGGAAPFMFSSFAINAVGRAAFKLIHEVRRQFNADPGIMKGTSKPNYGACVAIVTKAAQRELLSPAILAILLPIGVGFGFSIGKPAVEIAGKYYNLAGPEALGGFLAGAILSGQLMAVLLANAGGIWDNAKKLVEEGLHGGKGTPAHAASVVCDTVGDPFKDTAGPALNPLIKVMNLVALLLATTIIRPIGDKSLSVITGLCLIGLAASFFFAKKGSLSHDFDAIAHADE